MFGCVPVRVSSKPGSIWNITTTYWTPCRVLQTENASFRLICWSEKPPRVNRPRTRQWMVRFHDSSAPREHFSGTVQTWEIGLVGQQHLGPSQLRPLSHSHAHFLQPQQERYCWGNLIFCLINRVGDGIDLDGKIDKRTKLGRETSINHHAN